MTKLILIALTAVFFIGCNSAPKDVDRSTSSLISFGKSIGLFTKNMNKMTDELVDALNLSYQDWGAYVRSKKSSMVLVNKSDTVVKGHAPAYLGNKSSTVKAYSGMNFDYFLMRLDHVFKSKKKGQIFILNIKSTLSKDAGNVDFSAYIKSLNESLEEAGIPVNMKSYENGSEIAVKPIYKKDVITTSLESVGPKGITIGNSDTLQVFVSVPATYSPFFLKKELREIFGAL